jgi:hypothetical protein
VTLEVFVREYPYVGGHLWAMIKDKVDIEKVTSWRRALFIRFGLQLA